MCEISVGEVRKRLVVPIVLNWLALMQGRITEHQLPEAERCMPGITQFYAGLSQKPATFLDLLWAFEGRKCRRSASKTSRKRSRR